MESLFIQLSDYIYKSQFKKNWPIWVILCMAGIPPNTFFLSFRSFGSNQHIIFEAS